MAWNQAYWLIIGAFLLVIGMRSLLDSNFRERTARRGARTDAFLGRVPLIRRIPSAPTARGWIQWGWALLVVGAALLIAQTVDLIVGGRG